MEWFNIYNSNTLAASGNQSYFLTGDDNTHTGRIYYKVFSGGKNNYSLFFSNTIDSTYADGTHSHCNLICDSWEIKRATLGISKKCDCDRAGEVEQVSTITFNGITHKSVERGEIFFTDPIELNADKGDYVCVEIEFCGAMIPYHEESMIPAFVNENGNWIPSKKLPFPSMVGCDRKVKKRIGYLGDSITQGVGTQPNSYRHWNAVVAEILGEDYSYWNLGLGFGRASDAATDGIWLYKAKQTDVVTLCFGVNDIIQNHSSQQIKEDLLNIIEKLKSCNITIILQTIPPFSFEGQALQKWLDINNYIRTTLSKYADAVFDVAPLLVQGSESLGIAKYEPHPNESGCKIWAEAIAPVIKSKIEE